MAAVAGATGIESPRGAGSGSIVDPLLDRSEKMLEDSQASLRRLAGQLALAEAVKDLIRVDCLKEKHEEMRELVRRERASMTDLIEATTRVDPILRLHAGDSIRDLHGAVLAVREAADRCMGDLLLYSHQGTTTVELVVDPNIPQTDTNGPNKGLPGAGDSIGNNGSSSGPDGTTDSNRIGTGDPLGFVDGTRPPPASSVM